MTTMSGPDRRAAKGGPMARRDDSRVRFGLRHQRAFLIAAGMVLLMTAPVAADSLRLDGNEGSVPDAALLAELGFSS